MESVTLIVPYYRNVAMLERQLHEWEFYPPDIRIILVDDGSPEPAREIVLTRASNELLDRVRLYRIKVDIPWNREGARNLGSREADTAWLVHVDIDHVLPVASAAALVKFRADPGSWYRFPRWRVGKADETRKKDKLEDACEFGRIHPHVDSYLMPRALYWTIGGYDEDFSGCLGGGSDFLRRAARAATPRMLPEEIPLHVFTRDKIKDASDWSLSRDTSQGKEIARRKGARAPKGCLRFPWGRVL